MSQDILTMGRCLCGAVNYTITGRPIRMAQCHCKDCQRASGTGHAALAFFPEDQVSVTGETASHGVTADSGNVNTRYFCPSCGSWLFSTNSGRAGVRGVTAGTCENNGWFDPVAVLFTQHREAWDITTDKVPNFPAMPT